MFLCKTEIRETKQSVSMESERQEVEMEVEGASDDSVVNPSRAKMPNSGEEPIMLPQPVIRNNSRGRYWECLKNHAVGIGGHALDGCGEFMAAGADGTLDALRCAACNCHRNFHRKEAEIVAGEPFLSRRYQAPPFAAWTPAGYMPVAGQQRGAATLVLPSVGGGGGTQASRDDQEDGSEPRGRSKKRFRTKFTQEQKDKMLAFAEKLGWRIQKQDDNAVQEFCDEIGVKRQVLKVWMHNNKHTLGKKT